MTPILRTWTFWIHSHLREECRLHLEATKLADNVRPLVGALIKAKPSTAKGQYVKSVTLSTTMGVGIKVDPNLFQAEA